MIIVSHPSFSNNNSIRDKYKFLFIRPPPSRLLRNFLLAPLERRFFMQNFNTESYFHELDTYLDLRDLSINTRKNYHSSLKAYLNWLSETLAVSPEDATYDNIRTYLLHLKKNRKLSNHSINAHASTIRFFRIYILKQGWSQVEVPRMKYRTKLPFILSKEEALAFIDSIPNLKHKAFIVLLYSSGLRISEVCSLRYEDIQRKNLRIFIRDTKNRSERYAMLSTSALDILTVYWQTHGKPRGWLFPGRKPDSHIVKDTGSVYIQRHLDRLKWNLPVTAHTFRHSFATHLYEQGTDLVSIKNHLGHRSLNSTLLYVHLARTGMGKAVSPFDVR